MATEPTLTLPDLTGVRALITGGNSGLGFETAKRLALAGADVTITARNASKGAAALEELQAAVAAVPDARGIVALTPLDLANLGSVRTMASDVVSQGHPLDLLFNNAGVMAVPKRTLTDDGFELQFGTNHLGHFALTGLLLPALMRAENPRVVTMSSLVHWSGRLAFDDLQHENRYRPWSAYGQSKLANLMFAKELAKRSTRLGWGILSVAAHPGFSRTNLQSSGPNLGRDKPSSAGRMGGVPGLSQSAAAGALPELFAATSTDLLGGDYVGPSGFLELTGTPGFSHFAKRAENSRASELLWSVSEELTGVTFPLD